MSFIDNYPFLTQDEFEATCHEFCSSFGEVDLNNTDWESIDLLNKDGVCFVKIVRVLKTTEEKHSTDRNIPSTSEHNAFDIEDDQDEEALQTRQQPTTFRIAYDLILSHSYAVPVVYFSIQDGYNHIITDVDIIYGTIVPPDFHSQMRDVGIMGATSTVNHPLTDVPVFLVHPCQTAAALQEAADGRRITTQEYLRLWLGVIGISVGLHEPLSAKLCKSRPNKATLTFPDESLHAS